MTDVVEIAKERRVRLAAEIGKLDDFIRMAEALVKYSQGLGRGPVIDADGAAPRVLLPDRGRDADCIREDMEARDGAAVILTRSHRQVQAKIDGQIHALRNRTERRFNKLENARRLATRYGETAASHLGFKNIASIRLGIRKFANTAYSKLASRDRIKRRFDELKNARRLVARHDKTAASYLGFKNIASIRLWSRNFAGMAYTNLLPIGQLRDRREPMAHTVTANEETIIVEDNVLNVSFQSDLAHDNSLAQASAAFRAGAGNFAFDDKASASEDESVPIGVLSNDAAPVDVHVGQRIRQRRWMMGMTQQRLGGLVGVELEQIQKYETGAIHIGAGRMWDVAAAMEVPMSYFFEGLDGQAPDTGEARGEILTDKKALALVRGAPRARTAVAS